MNIKSSISTKLNRLVALLVAVSIVSLMIIMALTNRAMLSVSEKSLTEQAIKSTTTYVDGQTKLSDEELNILINTMELTAKKVSYAYENPEEVVPEPVREIDDFADEDVAGKTTFHYTTFDGKSNKNPEVLEELKIISGIKSDFETARNQCPEIVVVNLYTASGISVGFDENVLDKVGLGGFDPIALNKDYYIVPTKTGETFVSDSYEDSYGRGLMVTVACPVFANDKLIGVVAGDALIDKIYDLVCAGDTPIEGGYKVLLSASGELICAKDTTKGDTVQTILGEKTEEILNEVVDSNSGHIKTIVNNEDVYVMYDTMECGWTLLTILPVASILEPVKEMNRLILTASLITAVVGVIILLIMILIAYKVCSKLMKPLLSLTNSVEEITGDNLDFKADIHTGDEIELLSDKFKTATERMKKYVENIARITAEKEKIGAELNVAAQIQMDMLPRSFPEVSEFELYASMNPAKEVGGDFYDFFKIDDKRIGLVMADVSGKGIPAALFMVISKTLVKMRAMLETVSPADVLSVVNNQLCEGNDASMFCTCWLGILDIETGNMVCSSAGHEFPAIRDNTGKFSLLKDPHGVPLAAMEDMPFTNYELTLHSGDAIFVYTDGVPEATNGDNELFGEGRMIDALNISPADSPEALLNTVKSEIDKFVGDTPQFDDITMLCLNYKG